MNNQMTIIPAENETAMGGYIDELSESTATYCSMTVENNEDKLKLYRAMNNPTGRIGDQINKTLLVTDVFCEVVPCVNKETGEVNYCPRTVLITKDGESYQAVSMGIFSSVKKLMKVFGRPTWKDGLPLSVKQITKDKNKVLTLDVNL